MSQAELAAWVRSRGPKPPEELATRLATAVREAPAEVADQPLPQALMVLARRLVRGVVGRDPQGRECALDLLAADAFITYAFEAQAELDERGLKRLAEEVWQA